MEPIKAVDMKQVLISIREPRNKILTVFNFFHFHILIIGLFLLSGCYIKGSITDLEETIKVDKTTNSTTTTIPTTTITSTTSTTTTTTLPTGPSVSLNINSGAASTTALTVTVDITASGDSTEMYITNTSGCTSGGAWESVASSKSNWALAGTNSSQTVYIKVRNASLTESSCSNHSINQVIQVNAVITLLGDLANNSLTTTPTFTFNYSTTGNTYSFGNFEVSVGSTVGATNILNWTSIANSQSFSQTGLTLTQDTDYFVNVRAKDSMGNVSTSVSTSWRSVASVTVGARFAAAVNWMDYVKVSNTAQACDNTINGYYNCLHGGEKKTITVTGENSCTGLSAYDVLGVFTWTCVAGTPVSFITKEVKSGKGLKDLVTATGWINNRVFVIKNGNPLKASTYSAWWSNTVTALPTSTGPTNTDIGAVSGTIYVVASDQTSFGYNILSNKTAVVVKSTATLKLDAAVTDNCTLPFTYDPWTCLFMGSTNSELGSYSWFEGSFHANGNTTGILWIGWMARHFVLYESQVFGFRYAMYGAIRSDLIRGNVLALNAVGFSNATNNSLYSTYRENKFINSFLELSHGSQSNIISQNLIFSQFGFEIPLNSNNVLAYNTVVSSGAVNLVVNTSAARNTVHNYLNSGELLLISGSDRTTLSHVAADNFTVAGSGATNFKISGNLAMNTCNIALAPNDGINSSCALIAPSNGTIVSISSPNNSFLGRITADSNFTGYNSSTGIDYSTITNFTKFDSFFTGWLDAANFACETGDTCFLYSSKIKSTDSVILNKSGNLSSTNAAFPTLSTDLCPAEVHGNITATDQLSTPNTYLLNAMEIIGDEIGDDNGLCETNETCIYAPNIGAYQGSGDYSTKTCVFQNGIVTGVQMYAYPVNGE